MPLEDFDSRFLRATLDFALCIPLAWVSGYRAFASCVDMRACPYPTISARYRKAMFTSNQGPLGLGRANKLRHRHRYP